MNNKLNLELDLNELNLVMGGLGKLPYEQSFQLVDKIRQQVAPQIQEQQQQTGSFAPMGAGNA
jgi:hypothetical protein